MIITCSSKPQNAVSQLGEIVLYQSTRWRNALGNGCRQGLQETGLLRRRALW